MSAAQHKFADRFQKVASQGVYRPEKKVAEPVRK
jgi:hypothetical protein